MQDFCFHTVTQNSVLVYLQSLGLAASDKDGAIRPLIEYACHDKVVETPGEYIYDGTEMVVVKDPVVLPGGYVVCRATDEQAALIEATPLPDGVELVEPPAALPLFGGEWLSPTLEYLISVKKTEINSIRDTKLTSGFKFKHGDLSYTLQTRDDNDRINWLGVLSAATSMVLAGKGEETTTIRTLENDTLTITYLESQILMLQTLQYQTDIYKAAWDHKDAVEKLMDKKLVKNYDCSINWPSN